MVIRWYSIASVVLLSGVVACSATNDANGKASVAPSTASELKSVSLSESGNRIDFATHVGGKLILGMAEWVTFPNIAESYRARVDTGAKTSSINAIDIHVFERNDASWVSFKIASKASVSKLITLPVERWVKIRQSNTDQPQRRPVVECWIKVGERYDNVEFTLADRKHLKYPILLGRRYFSDMAVVDVSRQYIQGNVK